MKKAYTFSSQFLLCFIIRSTERTTNLYHFTFDCVNYYAIRKWIQRSLWINIFAFSILLSFPSKLYSQERTKNNEIEKYIKDFTQLVNKTHKERTILLTPFYGKGISSLDSIQLFTAFNEIDAFGF
jgi:hypothetical protein